jgi:hypothetical protein
MNRSCPPGRSTRATSASARSGKSTVHSTSVDTTVSSESGSTLRPQRRACSLPGRFPRACAPAGGASARTAQRGSARLRLPGNGGWRRCPRRSRACGRARLRRARRAPAHAPFLAAAHHPVIQRREHEVPAVLAVDRSGRRCGVTHGRTLNALGSVLFFALFVSLSFAFGAFAFVSFAFALVCFARLAMRQPGAFTRFSRPLVRDLPAGALAFALFSGSDVVRCVRAGFTELAFGFSAGLAGARQRHRQPLRGPFLERRRARGLARLALVAEACIERGPDGGARLLFAGFAFPAFPSRLDPRFERPVFPLQRRRGRARLRLRLRRVRAVAGRARVMRVEPEEQRSNDGRSVHDAHSDHSPASHASILDEPAYTRRRAQ